MLCLNKNCDYLFRSAVVKKIDCIGLCIIRETAYVAKLNLIPFIKVSKI